MSTSSILPFDVARALRVHSQRGKLPVTAAAMAALLLLYGAWQLSGWPAGNRAAVGDAFFYPVVIAAICSALGAARRSQETRLLSGWRLIALACASYLLGNTAQMLYELEGRRPYPSVADAFYLLFYPLMLCGLLRLPSAPKTRVERVRLGLDVAVVAVAGYMVAMYVVLGPSIVASGTQPLQTAFSIAYPVGDLVLLVGVGSLLLGDRPGSRTPLLLLACALLFFVSADLVYGYVTLHGTYKGGDPIDAGWMIAIALLTVAGAAQGPPEPQKAFREPRQRPSWVPCFAVAAGLGLVLANQRNDAPFPGLSLVIGAVLITGLVSVRQLLAQRDLIETQGELRHQSLHDALTGLPNRALVIDRAEQMLARAHRRRNRVAALFVDIDGFKHINDVLGHAAGDQVLRIVAGRLSSVVRQADTVARLSGDEFVVLVDGYTLDAEPELIATRISDVIAQPIEIDTDGQRRALDASVSVGIAIGVRATADELLRDADLALCAAKTAGKNRWVMFESEMQRAAEHRFELEHDLREALAQGQLRLLYQPMFELASERMTGVEALLRWEHPARGAIPPDLFIPVAEDSGLIVPIGRWVLHSACRQAAEWHQGGLPLAIAVNVSARQLDENRLVNDVTQALEHSGVDPATLTIEITETALMRDADSAAKLLHALKTLGIRIAIDDFGTGYCSLAYLRQFPVDALKIDRSFISGAPISGNSKAIVHTLVQLAKALELQTVAEGIEQQAQLRDLREERCDYGQGYLFARPLEAPAIEDIFRRQSRLRRPIRGLEPHQAAARRPTSSSRPVA